MASAAEKPIRTGKRGGHYALLQVEQKEQKVYLKRDEYASIANKKQNVEPFRVEGETKLFRVKAPVIRKARSKAQRAAANARMLPVLAMSSYGLF